MVSYCTQKSAQSHCFLWREAVKMGKYWVWVNKDKRTYKNRFQILKILLELYYEFLELKVGVFEENFRNSEEFK